MLIMNNYFCTSFFNSFFGFINGFFSIICCINRIFFAFFFYCPFLLITRNHMESCIFCTRSFLEIISSSIIMLCHFHFSLYNNFASSGFFQSFIYTTINRLTLFSSFFPLSCQLKYFYFLIFCLPPGIMYIILERGSFHIYKGVLYLCESYLSVFLLFFFLVVVMLWRFRKRMNHSLNTSMGIMVRIL